MRKLLFAGLLLLAACSNEIEQGESLNQTEPTRAGEFTATPVELTTPNGTKVYGRRWSEILTQDQIDAINEEYKNKCGEFAGTATASYNCHGFAWKGTNADLCHLEKFEVEEFWNDESYIITTADDPDADIIFYPEANHSALILKNERPLVMSKWGELPLMKHDPFTCGGYDTTNLRYYKINPYYIRSVGDNQYEVAKRTPSGNINVTSWEISDLKGDNTSATITKNGTNKAVVTKPTGFRGQVRIRAVIDNGQASTTLVINLGGILPTDIEFRGTGTSGKNLCYKSPNQLTLIFYTRDQGYADSTQYELIIKRADGTVEYTSAPFYGNERPHILYNPGYRINDFYKFEIRDIYADESALFDVYMNDYCTGSQQHVLSGASHVDYQQIYEVSGSNIQDVSWSVSEGLAININPDFRKATVNATPGSSGLGWVEAIVNDMTVLRKHLVIGNYKPEKRVIFYNTSIFNWEIAWWNPLWLFGGAGNTFKFDFTPDENYLLNEALADLTYKFQVVKSSGNSPVYESPQYFGNYHDISMPYIFQRDSDNLYKLRYSVKQYGKNQWYGWQDIGSITIQDPPATDPGGPGGIIW